MTFERASKGLAKIKQVLPKSSAIVKCSHFLVKLSIGGNLASSVDLDGLDGRDACDGGRE